MCDSRKGKWMSRRADELKSSVEPCLVILYRLEALRPWGPVVGSSLTPQLRSFHLHGAGGSPGMDEHPSGARTWGWDGQLL